MGLTQKLLFHSEHLCANSVSWVFKDIVILSHLASSSLRRIYCSKACRLKPASGRFLLNERTLNMSNTCHSLGFFCMPGSTGCCVANQKLALILILDALNVHVIRCTHCSASLSFSSTSRNHTFRAILSWPERRKGITL